IVDQVFTPNASPVTGRITRDRPLPSASGLGAMIQRNLAVVGVDVALVREDTGETIATTRTNESGVFTLTSLGLDGSPKLAVDVLASGEESFVTDANGKT